ncbi:MAG: formate dehydrogenase subunit alpha, partial [Desulfobacterales bacterium]|nr:formate dehydrogenase subunit alpha [Desulfobacterales bacterium]
EMAKRLGLDWHYTGPRDVFREMGQVMASLKYIPWERLEVEHSVTYPCPGPGLPGHGVVFGEIFPTPDGRARFTPASPAPAPEDPDVEYPFVLTTGRQLEHWHTGAMTRRARVLDALEPGPTATLHPKTLKRMGIAPGQKIRVITRRGSIILPARADTALQRHMVFIPFAYVEAPANLLTHPELDAHGKIPGFKYCAARVEVA